MTPSDLEGAQFGPTVIVLHADRVADYVAATSDVAERWRDAAPPGIASMLLFAVAGDLLWDPRIAAHTKTLLHVDQTFTFHGPIRVGAALTVTGAVARVRERAGAYFVSFAAEATDGDLVVVESTSTFLMSSEPAGDVGADGQEPPVHERGRNDALGHLDARVGSLPPLLRSASRSDLVRYAAATKDFNPIHWDHDAARAAGAPGVIVHGLLMLAWMLQGAGRIGVGPAPVAHVKARFRSPLRPGEQAAVSALVREVAQDGRDASVSGSVRRDDEDLVTGAVIVRVADG